jgi:hypothetical protein
MTETQHNKTSRFTFTVVPLPYLRQSLDNHASGFNIPGRIDRHRNAVLIIVFAAFDGAIAKFPVGTGVDSSRNLPSPTLTAAFSLTMAFSPARPQATSMDNAIISATWRKNSLHRFISFTSSRTRHRTIRKHIMIDSDGAPVSR